jgi:hypothetical protein
VYEEHHHKDIFNFCPAYTYFYISIESNSPKVSFKFSCTFPETEAYTKKVASKKGNSYLVAPEVKKAREA